MSPGHSNGAHPSIKSAYRQFLDTQRGAQTYDEFKRILYGNEDSLVQTLNNIVLQKLPAISRDEVAVCDIGGGNGKRIKRTLAFLH